MTFLECAQLLAAHSIHNMPNMMMSDSISHDSVASLAVETLAVDTVSKKESSSRVYSKKTDNYVDGVIDFEIKPLGKRYLEQGPDTFTRGRFYEHLNIGFYAGIHQFVPKSGWKVEPGLALGLNAGYDLTRLHALRVSAWYAAYGIDGTNRKLKHLGVDVDYLFNLTSYIYGYNRNRRFNLYPTLGMGYVLARFNEPQKHTFKGQVGLNLSCRVSPNVSLYAEPFFSLTYDGADHSPSNPGKYDMMYGAQVGAKVDLKNQANEDITGDSNGKYFFEFASGITMFNAEHLDLGNTLGGNYQFSFGKWLALALGFRITGHVSDYGWSSSYIEGNKVGHIQTTPMYEIRHKTRLLAGRGEVLINPINFGKKARVNERKFDLNLAVGGEYGWIDKYIPGTGDGLETTYTGFTAAIDFLYNIDMNASLYIQPRFSVVNYEVPYVKSSEVNKYTDEVYNLAAGVRIYRPLKGNCAKVRSNYFVPRYFVGGQIGTLRHALTSEWIGDRNVNISSGVHGGAHLFPLVSVKAQVDYMKLDKQKKNPYVLNYAGQSFTYNALWKHSYGLLSAKLLYMMNFSNLWQGYQSDRKLNVFLQTGPVYSYVIAENEKIYSKELQYNSNMKLSQREDVKGGFGWSGGIMAEISINPHWSILLEPQVDYYFDHQFIGKYNDTWSNSLLMHFNIGASYTF